MYAYLFLFYHATKFGLHLLLPRDYSDNLNNRLLLYAGCLNKKLKKWYVYYSFFNNEYVYEFCKTDRMCLQWLDEIVIIYCHYCSHYAGCDNFQLDLLTVQYLCRVLLLLIQLKINN